MFVGARHVEQSKQGKRRERKSAGPFRQIAGKSRRGVARAGGWKSRTELFSCRQCPNRRQPRCRGDGNALRSRHGRLPQLAQGKSDGDGSFKLDGGQPPEGSVFYLVAKSGTLKAAEAKGPNETLALLAVLGTALPNKVIVNELTTVASTFTAARFINGEAISGQPLGLRIAAGNVPNLVDPVTGGYGKVILDPINITQTTALANLNTLGSLISACATSANDDWRARFFKAATLTGGATPKNTLEAMAGIARASYAAPKELFALFEEAYPQPKDGSRRRRLSCHISPGPRRI